MTDRDLLTALILGVLLPALLWRPSFLVEHPMRDHTRRAWACGYSVFAFAGASFIYAAGVSTLKPLHGFSRPAGGAMEFAGLLILVLLCAQHIPPVLLPRRPARVVAAQTIAVFVLGVFGGGFLAEDELYPRSPTHTPAVAYVSWAVWCLFLFGVVLWYARPPEVSRLAYRYRRARRLRALRGTGARRVPTSTAMGSAAEAVSSTPEQL